MQHPHKELNLTESDIRRFWVKVEIKSEDECWNWTAFKNKQGYGRFGSSSCRCVNAHRVSWTIAFGPIPEGHFVCHRCDNPSCVNPKHLFTGTRQDNVDDMVIKKRSRHFKNHEFYGVVWESREKEGGEKRGRWRSFVCINQKMIYLSRHTGLVDAARNYDRIAYIVYGEREKLNFPEEYKPN